MLMNFIAMSLPNHPNVNFTIECYIRPGRSWPLEKQHEFVAELRGVAMETFGFMHESQLPEYQCLRWPDEAPEGAGLHDKVIAVARERVPWPSKRCGKMLAFSSAVLFSIPRLRSPVLHLGLTCIVPSARSSGLTKVLTTRIIVQTFVRLVALRREKLWVTNLACVVSSLGSVARGFDNVWPSPEYPHTPPSEIHAHIANSIALSPRLRKAMYVSMDCKYDPEKSVFQGSVKSTAFAKERDDARYHYRDRETHMFYDSLIDWRRSDEVLQVCNISHTSILLLPLRGKWGLPAKL
jgi:hypothetical protein